MCHVVNHELELLYLVRQFVRRFGGVDNQGRARSTQDHANTSPFASDAEQLMVQMGLQTHQRDRIPQEALRTRTSGKAKALLT